MAHHLAQRRSPAPIRRIPANSLSSHGLAISNLPHPAQQDPSLLRDLGLVRFPRPRRFGATCSTQRFVDPPCRQKALHESHFRKVLVDVSELLIYAYRFSIPPKACGAPLTVALQPAVRLHWLPHNSGVTLCATFIYDLAPNPRLVRRAADRRISLHTVPGTVGFFSR